MPNKFDPRPDQAAARAASEKAVSPWNFSPGSDRFAQPSPNANVKAGWVDQNTFQHESGWSPNNEAASTPAGGARAPMPELQRAPALRGMGGRHPSQSRAFHDSWAERKNVLRHNEDVMEWGIQQAQLGTQERGQDLAAQASASRDWMTGKGQDLQKDQWGVQNLLAKEKLGILREGKGSVGGGLFDDIDGDDFDFDGFFENMFSVYGQ